MVNRVKELKKLGQSPWYDNIERSLLLGGKLKQLIDEDGICGVTSNPSIFEKAINNSKNYAADIEAFSKSGKDATAIYDELTTYDVAKAADVLLDTYKSSNKLDGYVSIEVSPKLANDAEATVAEAKRLYVKINRANVMIKVPATAAGPEAIRQLTALGLNVNATLIFSLSHYTNVARAYLRGIEERAARGAPCDNIHSVASFFISRIDTFIDHKLNQMAMMQQDDAKRREMENLEGQAAVAQAKVMYETYQRMFATPEFRKLKGKGANPQRLLMASTSTKNPNYSDVKYVEEIIGQDTVNTLPQVTLDAWRGHGEAKQRTLSVGITEAKQVLAKLRSYGISMGEICQEIQEDGLAAFTSSYNKLIKSIETKRQSFIS